MAAKMAAKMAVAQRGMEGALEVDATAAKVVAPLVAVEEAMRIPRMQCMPSRPMRT